MSKTQFTPQDKLAQKLAQKQAQTKGNWGDGGLQIGVSPYKMIYGALTQAANRAMLSPLKTGNLAAANTLRQMAGEAQLAQRFPGSPGAAKIEDFFTGLGTQKMLMYQRGGSLKGGKMTFGDDFILNPAETQVMERAGAKILGTASRANNVLRPMAKGLGRSAKGTTPWTSRFASASEYLGDLFGRMSRGVPSQGAEAYGPYSFRAEANGSMWRHNVQYTPGRTPIRQLDDGRYWQEVAAKTRLEKTLEELKALKSRVGADGEMLPKPKPTVRRGTLTQKPYGPQKPTRKEMLSDEQRRRLLD